MRKLEQGKHSDEETTARQALRWGNYRKASTQMGKLPQDKQYDEESLHDQLHPEKFLPGETEEILQGKTEGILPGETDEILPLETEKILFRRTEGLLSGETDGILPEKLRKNAQSKLRVYCQAN